jgi:Ner family transcriptional regulator
MKALVNTKNSLPSREIVHSKPAEDWHRADIVAALRKKGWTLSRLSIHHGYIRTALGDSLRRPWPHGQRLIAEVLGVKPWEIWPSRYDEHGHPNSGRRERGGRRGNSTTPAQSVKPSGGEA